MLNMALMVINYPKQAFSDYDGVSLYELCEMGEMGVIPREYV